MGLNNAIEQKYLPEIKALLSLTETNLSLWQNSETREDKLRIESLILADFERMSNYEFEAHDVSATDSPTYEDVYSQYRDYSYLLSLTSARLRELGAMFLKRFNTQQLQLMQLAGMLRRINQKKAALELWNTSDAKLILAERFLNLDSLDQKYVSQAAAAVNTSQGVLTLPIRSQTSLDVSRTSLGALSNGASGNSDPVVQTNNNQTRFAVNGDPNNWFEYERMDYGPCVLEYNLFFAQPQIVNQINIEAVHFGLSIAFNIQDITFNLVSGETTSIKDIIPEFGPEFFTVKSVDADIDWSVVFLPVKCKSISISLSQNKSYEIEVATQDNRRVLRNRYAIGLKSIQVLRNEYEKAGAMNSTELDLFEGLYAAVPLVNYFPPATDFFTPTLDVSVDSGKTWLGSNFPTDTDPGTVLLSGDASTFLWKLNLNIKEDSFINLTSFTKSEDETVKVDSVLKTVSRFHSPAEIPIPDAIDQNRIIAIQPKIARRGDRYGGILLGEGGGQTTSFVVPVSVVEKGIKPERMRVFVGRREYSYVADNGAIGVSNWGFSDDYREVILGSGVPEKSKVYAVLYPEEMQFEKRSDGYYHEMKLLFDPDKDNIEIAYLPREVKRTSVLLPRDQTVVNLGQTHLKPGSASLISLTGQTYTEVSLRSDVFDAVDNDYFIDHVNGILYLAGVIGKDTVRMVFTHQTERTLEPEAFDVVIIDGRPWGVRIDPEHLYAASHTDTVGGSLFSVVNFVTREYVTRTNHYAAATDAMTLSQVCVLPGSVTVSSDFLIGTTRPEEVAFQNGRTEFLGLVPVDDELTNAISPAALSNFVTFQLNARSLWYQDLDVLFDDATVFVTKVTSVTAVTTGGTGDFFVDVDGTVYLNVGLNGTLPADISVSYMYKDPNFDPANKYSVDYAEGAVYSGGTLKAGGTVSYQATCYKVSYDIAKEIPIQSFDTNTSTVTVKTENFDEINSLIKVLWVTKNVTTTVRELKDFFSPIISSLTWRFI